MRPPFCFLSASPFLVKPVLFRVSPAGTIESQISLEPPQSPDVRVNAFRVGPGEVLVGYVQPQVDDKSNATQYFYLYSTLDGERLAAYTLDPALNGFFGCTDWRGGFSFLTLHPRWERRTDRWCQPLASSHALGAKPRARNRDAKTL